MQFENICGWVPKSFKPPSLIPKLSTSKPDKEKDLRQIMFNLTGAYGCLQACWSPNNMLVPLHCLTTRMLCRDLRARVCSRAHGESLTPADLITWHTRRAPSLTQAASAGTQWKRQDIPAVSHRRPHATVRCCSPVCRPPLPLNRWSEPEGLPCRVMTLEGGALFNGERLTKRLKRKVGFVLQVCAPVQLLSNRCLELMSHSLPP